MPPTKHNNIVIKLIPNFSQLQAPKKATQMVAGVLDSDILALKLDKENKRKLGILLEALAPKPGPRDRVFARFCADLPTPEDMRKAYMASLHKEREKDGDCEDTVKYDFENYSDDGVNSHRQFLFKVKNMTAKMKAKEQPPAAGGAAGSSGTGSVQSAALVERDQKEAVYKNLKALLTKGNTKGLDADKIEDLVRHVEVGMPELDLLTLKKLEKMIESFQGEFGYLRARLIQHIVGQ